MLERLRVELDVDAGGWLGRRLSGAAGTVGGTAALAAYERELMHERAAAARASARARGRHTGRPPRLTVEQVRQVRRCGPAGTGGVP